MVSVQRHPDDLPEITVYATGQDATQAAIAHKQARPREIVHVYSGRVAWQRVEL